MIRFALLSHDHPFQHWDFLLETAEHLLAWRLMELPVQGKMVIAEALPNHRKLYLNYEGPVSGNRGTVTQVDIGIYQWLVNSENEFQINIIGKMLNGIVVLKSRHNNWTFEWLACEN